MKKKNLVFLTLLLCTVFIFNGCQSQPVRINSDSLIVSPDPNNPFQGTWITTTSFGATYIHVINGMEGVWYLYHPDTLTGGYWSRIETYSIRSINDKFITTTRWQISVTSTSEGDILTFNKSIYNRYK